MYFYLKALHIIFIVTWFAGLFYMPRLFIYNTEANQKSNEEKDILQKQFGIMMKRLWYGITWPSAILTLLLGTWVLLEGNWHKVLANDLTNWLWFKLGFVVLLYGYHFSLHRILNEELRGKFRFSSQQLRIWNEVATIFLFAIVMLVVVKQNMSLLWGLGGLVVLVLLLMGGIALYKRLRR